MRVLVVLAHPLTNSLNARLADKACETLTGRGHDVTFVDLYREDFDPRLSPREREAYYADEPVALQHCPGAAELASCDALVLVFPTWWFGFPAILKGWFDRALAPGLAFDHGKDSGPIVPKLERLRHVVAVTTLGSAWWVDLLIMRRPVRRILRTAIIGGCAPHARLRYLPLHSADRILPGRLEAFEGRLRRVLSGLAV